MASRIFGFGRIFDITLLCRRRITIQHQWNKHYRYYTVRWASVDWARKKDNVYARVCGQPGASNGARKVAVASVQVVESR